MEDLRGIRHMKNMYRKSYNLGETTSHFENYSPSNWCFSEASRATGAEGPALVVEQS